MRRLELTARVDDTRFPRRLMLSGFSDGQTVAPTVMPQHCSPPAIRMRLQALPGLGASEATPTSPYEMPAGSRHEKVTSFTSGFEGKTDSIKLRITRTLPTLQAHP